MGVMQNLRSGTPIVLWILIISFGLLWVLSDVNFFDAITAGPSSLGSVNGDKITIQDYNSRIQYYVNAYSQQTGGSVTPEQRAFYETQAWEEIVTSKLLEQKMDELGITVTDQELIDMVLGPNPDPFIRQNFERDGVIDQAALQQALAADEYSDLWILIEDQLRQTRRQQKLNNFITAGLQVSTSEIEDAYIADNTTGNLAYVRFPYSEVDASEVEVSDSDVNAYYRENEEEFQQEESYRFNFVTFSILPTALDSQRVREEVAALRDDFAISDDDSLFLVRNGSNTRYSSTFVNKDELSDAFKPVLDVAVGEVTEVSEFGGRVQIIKKVAEEGDEVKFVTFGRDIIADPFTTVNAQFENADDFLYYAEERGSVVEEAESRDMAVQEAFATKGNSFIPRLGSSQQILNFLERSKKGDISEVLELASEFVLVEVLEVVEAGTRPLDEVRAQIENSVRIQKRQDIMLERVNGFLASANNLDALAQASSKEVSRADNLKLNSVILTGGGREPEVIGTIFGLEIGSLSAPIVGNTGIYVAVLESMTEPDLNLMDALAAEQYRNQIGAEKNSAYLNIWLEQLKDEANITDNRSRLIQ